MKVHYKAEDLVFGGSPITGPLEKSMKLDEEGGAVMVAYSFQMRSYVVATSQGQVVAEGTPKELAGYMTEYLMTLQRFENLNTPAVCSLCSDAGHEAQIHF